MNMICWLQSFLYEKWGSLRLGLLYFLKTNLISQQAMVPNGPLWLNGTRTYIIWDMKQDAGINYNIELLANVLSRGDEKDWPTRNTMCFCVARGWIAWSYMEIIGDVRAMQIKILNLGFENCKPISMLQHMCNKHFLYTLFNGLVCWIGKNQIAWNDSC